MPLTKSAKRALRSSKKKERVNKETQKRLEVAIKNAYRKKSKGTVKIATSLVDRAKKRGLIHKNKAARVKSKLSRLPTSKTS